MNGADIVTTSNATIDLAPNGTGTVVVRGNTNSGAIVFNCESNSHGQKVIAQPHSAGVTNVMLLPAGADSTLVSLVSTDTLTNKTLTSPKINEDVAVTSTATELNLLDGVTATTAELNILDGVTSTAAELNALDGITAVVGELNALDIGSTAVGTAVASKAVILDSNKDYTGFRNITLSGELDAGSLDVSGDADIDGTLETDALSINGTAVTSTAAELNLIDGGASTGTTAVADADGIITNDGGTMRLTTAATFKTYFQSGLSTSSAADDITAGDAAVNITTSSGNITVDAAANDTDIIFKGTDGGADITALTLDMSAAGTAIFNHDITIADDGQVGSASAVDAMIISSAGIVTFKDDILIKDGGTIGVASTADALTLSSAGLLTVKDDLVIKSGGTIGGANDTDLLTLGNASLSVAGALLPGTDDTFDLGSANFQWRDIYTGDINLNNTKTRDNEVDGTRGSWTIQEGSKDLFLLNRLNGKKYKFNLTEV